MSRLGLWPQPASTGLFEELAEFAVDAAVFAADGDREQEDDELMQRKFSVSGEMRGIAGAGESSWNQLQEGCK